MRFSSFSFLVASIFLLTSCAASVSPAGNDTAQSDEKEFRIAFVSNRDGQSDVYSMKPDGSDVIRITSDAEIDTNPVWSPNRIQLAYTSYVAIDLDIERSKIFIINADGTERRQLFDRPMGELFPSWSPDGRQILYTLRFIFLAGVDGQEDTLLLADTKGDLLQTPAWSPDGQQIAFVAFSDTGNEIRIMHKDGSNIRSLTQGYQPAWSQDGQRIVFYSLVGEQSDIFVINVDGSGLQQLTNNSTNDVSPDWSPDGKQIVFVSDRDSNEDIYVMNADGSNQVRLTNNPTEDSSPAWRR